MEKEAKLKAGNKEVRQRTAKIELRSSDSGTEYIEAYALKFDKWSNDLGWYTPVFERINKRALNEADMSNVVALFNHNSNMVLGRNTITEGPGSVSLEVDGIGLKWRCIPTDTSYSRDLMANIRAGVINQCSFAFTIADEEDAEDWIYNKEKDQYERTVNKIGVLYDVSVVTNPAYSDTEAVVAERSLDKLKELDEKRKRADDPQGPEQRFFDYLKIMKARAK